MNTLSSPGELRPSITVRQPDDFMPPLLQLRAGGRRAVIEPEDCLVTKCPVCAWRKAGLLDLHRTGDDAASVTAA